MPRITDDQIDEEYLKKYLLTAIMPNGDIIAILRNKDEKNGFHYESFERLINEISIIYKRYFGLKPKVGCDENIEEFCSKGIVPISINDTFEIPDREDEHQIVGIPNNCKEKQFESLKKLLPIFENVGNFAYYTYVDEKKTTEGLDNFRSFIDSNLSRLKNDEIGFNE